MRHHPRIPQHESPAIAGGASLRELAKAQVGPASEPRHTRIADVSTDNSAEGIAISPDGTLVATVNMRGTEFPPGSPRFQRQSTVTLLRFDTESGGLTKVADYLIDGVLPEGGAFDLLGDHFLATVFQGHEGATADTGPGLETFRVVKGPKPRLERLGRIAMPHGVHHVVLTP
ncbi:hypothetical protein [Bosea sp. PAMC 26642]|uniref:hypothetical protein n=1 Tax=Bosea sp. (strain PAMC 26642) TaxID=1792307 RepID=UPI0012E7F28D|nr:hypothetical protein [Bosea sp. PAMC 26642]